MIMRIYNSSHAAYGIVYFFLMAAAVSILTSTLLYFIYKKTDNQATLQ